MLLFDVIVVYSDDFALQSARGGGLTLSDGCIYIHSTVVCDVE